MLKISHLGKTHLLPFSTLIKQCFCKRLFLQFCYAVLKGILQAKTKPMSHHSFWHKKKHYWEFLLWEDRPISQIYYGFAANHLLLSPQLQVDWGKLINTSCRGDTILSMTGRPENSKCLTNIDNFQQKNCGGTTQCSSGHSRFSGCSEICCGLHRKTLPHIMETRHAIQCVS